MSYYNERAPKIIFFTTGEARLEISTFIDHQVNNNKQYTCNFSFSPTNGQCFNILFPKNRPVLNPSVRTALNLKALGQNKERLTRLLE